MRLSERIKSIKPSATLAINAKAQQLRARGARITSLAVGEPDFATPAHVKDAAKAAIDQDFTKYTAEAGIPELRRAVAGYFQRFYGAVAPMEAVTVTNGGKQSLYNLFQALLDPGDEALIPAPYWLSYPDMVLLAGGAPVIVPTDPGNDFLAGIDDLERRTTKKTRLLILNSPSNPTGCHYGAARLLELAEWAKSRGVFVVSDEIYDQLVYAPAEPCSLSPWWEKNPECCAVVNGLAKSFAMTGWRVGYTLAHPDLIKAMGTLQGQSTSNVCSPAQKAALAALTGPWDFPAALREAFHRRRDLALEIVNTWPGVVCPKPDGAFYLFPSVAARYTAAVADSTAMCARILEEAQVAVVPGAAFGDDRCLRFSYAVADDVLAEALTRVGKVLAA
ncbi:MAG: pyridoxal phosphate-dependent aminotransferase [Desulfovibrionaceae bacterium]|nr:pyridoxal phosphate-dependent aminotransferase [Desulfovibrionaceae bacterium]MBF0514983.1 pyridoxal phosphate-dependent aminotransferase [Desulfovibrionaceae bacterium]